MVDLRLEDLTLKQGESISTSGIETGALRVLRSNIFGVSTPISRPQHGTKGTSSDWKFAGTFISDAASIVWSSDALAEKFCPKMRNEFQN